MILFCVVLSNGEILEHRVWEPGSASNPSHSNSVIARVWLDTQVQLVSSRNALIFSKSYKVFIFLFTLLIHLECILNIKKKIKQNKTKQKKKVRKESDFFLDKIIHFEDCYLSQPFK